MRTFTAQENEVLMQHLEQVLANKANAAKVYRAVAAKLGNGRTNIMVRNRYYRIFEAEREKGTNMCRTCGVIKKGHSCPNNTGVATAVALPEVPMTPYRSLHVSPSTVAVHVQPKAPVNRGLTNSPASDDDAVPLEEVPYAAGNIVIPPGGESPVSNMDQMLQVSESLMQPGGQGALEDGFGSSPVAPVTNVSPAYVVDGLANLPMPLPISTGIVVGSSAPVFAPTPYSFGAQASFPPISVSTVSVSTASAVPVSHAAPRVHHDLFDDLELALRGDEEEEEEEGMPYRAAPTPLGLDLSTDDVLDFVGSLLM